SLANSLIRCFSTLLVHDQGILKLLGMSALRTVRLLRHATELIVAALASLISLLASLIVLSAWIRPKAA
ncbi:MAG TPA: hypothetical protein PKD81_14815, partial [Thiolinea sp.]|nr:hypothetical protein [Thiolinea sp.]